MHVVATSSNKQAREILTTFNLGHNNYSFSTARIVRKKLHVYNNKFTKTNDVERGVTNSVQMQMIPCLFYSVQESLLL
jgi:hypothetical protein